MSTKIILGSNLEKQITLDLDRLFVEGLLIQGITGTQKSSFVGTVLKQIKEKEDVQLIIIEKDKQFKVLRKFFPMVWVSNEGEIPPILSYARSLGKAVRESGASVMLDLSSFHNWSDRQKFIGEFSLGVLDVQDEIYSKKCLVVIDEGQLVVPQGKKSFAIDAVAELAQTGRKYGIRLVIMTQSLSEIDKSVSKQLSTRIVGRTVEDIDRERASKLLTGSKTKLFNEIWHLSDGEYYARGNAISEDLVKFFRISDDSLQGWNSKELFALDEKGKNWVREIRSNLQETVPENEIEKLRLENKQKDYLIEDLRKQVRTAKAEGFEDALAKMKKLVET